MEVGAISAINEFTNLMGSLIRELEKTELSTISYELE